MDARWFRLWLVVTGWFCLWLIVAGWYRLWLVVTTSHSLWLVVSRWFRLWLVVTGCNCLWLVVTGCHSLLFFVAGWYRLWLVMTDHDCSWLVVAISCDWLTGYDCLWLVVAGWYCLPLLSMVFYSTTLQISPSSIWHVWWGSVQQIINPNHEWSHMTRAEARKIQTTTRALHPSLYWGLIVTSCMFKFSWYLYCIVYTVQCTEPVLFWTCITGYESWITTVFNICSPHFYKSFFITWLLSICTNSLPIWFYI